MEINRNNINQIIKDTNIIPSKDYGQNFLVEPKICLDIVNSLSIDDKDTVLEIGPGLGSLTHFILEKTNNLDVVDIDERITYYLNIIYQNSNLNIINQDIRKHDISNYTKIIGNLPYNITTELVTYLLLNAKKCNKMVLMIQTEALPRFIDTKGKEYGPVSILIHLLGSIKKLFNVKAGCFYPAPKCGSTVFEINLNENADFETATSVYKFAKIIFNNRRKTIYNNLSQYLHSKEKALEILKNLNLSQMLRPEDLEPDIFKKLYELSK